MDIVQGNRQVWGGAAHKAGDAMRLKAVASIQDQQAPAGSQAGDEGVDELVPRRVGCQQQV